MENRVIKALEEKLKEGISGEVRFDDGSKALYSTDASNYRQIPIGVVVPKTKEDIINTVEICRQYNAPVLCRGGGTSLAGQCCNVAIVIDFSKYYNKILEINYDEKYAIVQPGLVLDTLRHEVEKHNLTFAPDPSTHTHCTFGGMIGNNSCGTHSVYGGKTDDNVLELEILTYDGLHMKVGKPTPVEVDKYIQEGGRKGKIYDKLQKFVQKYGKLIEERYPDIPRCVSGYNLPWLLPKNNFDVAKALVGSESTLVIVLEAKVRLIYRPPARSLLVLGYPDVYEAANHIEEVMAHKPTALEGIDENLVTNMKKKKIHPQDIELLPVGRGWLMCEFGGESKEESDAKAKGLMEELKKKDNPPTMKLFDDAEHEEKLWLVRESGLGATARVPGEKDTWAGWEDSAVPPQKLSIYLRELKNLYKKYEYNCALYGHFGQACVHTRIDFDLYTAEGIRRYRSFLDEASDLCHKMGGSFSGEHGDGQSRADLLPKMFGQELIQAFREYKSIWDPTWNMNPGKVVDAYSVTENLRLGSHYNPQKLKTHFHFGGDDEGNFAKAALRCVGIGKCRKMTEGTMCPSYMVTKEEMHSTRGRAHMLFELIQGKVIGKRGWRDKYVKEALDLCLSCKGCKGECPMSVDMATYKAEFLSHYYWFLRPRHAYAFGLIFRWARIASWLPKVANFFVTAPVLSKISKWMAGAAQERHIPLFADKTFKKGFHEKKHPKGNDKVKVILWADTFNNYFHPKVAHAAVEVLEHLGFEVTVPKVHLCCGRPLYDYGMLPKAKRLLKEILRELEEDIQLGTPIIGLEPSCVSVFRDELGDLFHGDINATRLSEHTFLLSEFIQRYVQDYKFNKIKKKALVHGHCHHKSILQFKSEKELLERLLDDYKILDSGCCGLAGSFGFEKKKYDISMKIGDRVLFPAIREASSDTLIITNGFSCHEQIKQATGREVLHLSEVLRMSIRNET